MIHCFLGTTRRTGESVRIVFFLPTTRCARFFFGSMCVCFQVLRKRWRKVTLKTKEWIIERMNEWKKISLVEGKILVEGKMTRKKHRSCDTFFVLFYWYKKGEKESERGFWKGRLKRRYVKGEIEVSLVSVAKWYAMDSKFFKPQIVNKSEHDTEVIALCFWENGRLIVLRTQHGWKLLKMAKISENFTPKTAVDDVTFWSLFCRNLVILGHFRAKSKFSKFLARPEAK